MNCSCNSLLAPAVDYIGSWRQSTSIWINSHPTIYCFWFLLLPVEQTIVKCMFWARFLLPGLAVLWWTNWCLGCCCDSSGVVLGEAPVGRLDSDLIPPCCGVSGAMICPCGKVDDDDHQKEWDVLRKIWLPSSQNGMCNSLPAWSTQHQSNYILREVADVFNLPVICSKSLQ